MRLLSIASSMLALGVAAVGAVAGTAIWPAAALAQPGDDQLPPGAEDVAARADSDSVVNLAPGQGDGAREGDSTASDEAAADSPHEPAPSGHRSDEPPQEDDEGAAPVEAATTLSPASSNDGSKPEMGEGEEEEEESEEYDPLDWTLIPIIAGTSDLGVGGALFAQVLWYDEGAPTYRNRIFAVTSLTHLLIQTHGVHYDHFDFGDIPLRLSTSVFFNANPNFHYCGTGNQADCSGTNAERFLIGQGLAPGTDAFAEAAEHVYNYRIMNLAFMLRLRYTELFGIPGLVLDARWRGERWWSGFFSGDGPYTPSIYGRDHPNGEEGFLSELQVGVVYDARDRDVNTTSGYLLGAYIRGTHRYIGSAWDYFGATLLGSTYVALDEKRWWIWASRVTADVMVGSPSVMELGRVGGFWPEPALGGSMYGRGIRQGRIVGRIKVIGQTELRATFYRFEKRGVSLGMQALFDVGWVGLDWDDWGGNIRRLDVGFGGGVNIRWAREFVLRFEVGFSPTERYDPQYYMSLADTF